MTSKACKLSRLCASFIGLSLVVCSANAHESHDTRIQHLEHQLDQLPTDSDGESVELVLRRADLHRRQTNWDAALHDYQHVARHDPLSSGMMFGRAQLHLDQQQYADSIHWSTRLLRLQPEHAMAQLQYARALAGMGDNKNAAAAFDGAIKQLAKPRPEHYIEHAQAVLADKHGPNTQRTAIAILDSGAQALGHPISLHSLSVELERHSGLHDAALSRIDKVLGRNSSLLNWRLQRGELLVELERSGEALSEIHCVIQTIQRLPEHRRRSHAFQTMMQRSRELVAQLNASSTTGLQSSSC